MSLVGPRPEVRKWVQVDPIRWATVLAVRPGITDPASLVYRYEERILASCSDPETTYKEQILPRKLALYQEYVRTRTLSGDVVILGRTVVTVVEGLLHEAAVRLSTNTNTLARSRSDDSPPQTVKGNR